MKHIRLQLKKWMGTAILVWGSMHAMSQEAEWEPQTNITGYIATEIDYFDQLEGYDRNYGVSLSEAGLLSTYQPNSRLTLKGVFVYRPNLSIDQMLNEANAEWKASEILNIKVGRFLTPLSPMNTYYYAPVNSSATLPFIISHHEFFPLNMDAVSINGEAGDNFKIDYDVFAGGFRNTLWLKTGAVGFFGNEDVYYDQVQPTGYQLDISNANSSLSFGTGAHVGFSWDEFINVGFNAMKPSKEIATVNYITGLTRTFDVDRIAYGLNFKIKYNSLQLLGEYWKNEMNFKNETYHIDNDHNVKVSFFELSNNLGKVTPYLRYEYHDASDHFYERYTAGINYKPLFETTLKLEYMFYDHSIDEINAIVASIIYSF